MYQPRTNAEHLLGRLHLDNPKHPIFRATEPCQRAVIKHGFASMWDAVQWGQFLKNSEMFHPKAFEFVCKWPTSARALDLLAESRKPFVAPWELDGLSRIPQALAIKIHEGDLAEDFFNVDCDLSFYDDLSGVMGEHAAADCVLEALRRCDDTNEFFPELTKVVASHATYHH